MTFKVIEDYFKELVPFDSTQNNHIPKEQEENNAK